MPNHIQNILTFEGDSDTINRLFETIKGDNSAFDFNRLIPMPKELDIEVGSKTELSNAVYIYKTTGKILDRLKRWQQMCGKDNNLVTIDDCVNFLLETSKANLALTKRAYNNFLKYGHTGWYSWRNGNWGTRWNAYEVEKTNNGLRFKTAWASPIPIICTLAEMFFDVKITLKYADEDAGNNCGKITFTNDCINDDNVQNCSPEAYALYVECWGEDAQTDCLYKDEHGNYRPKKCSECTLCD